MDRHPKRSAEATTDSPAALVQLQAAVMGLLGHRADTAQCLEAALREEPGLVPALCIQSFALSFLGRRDLQDSARQRATEARRALAARGGSEPERALVDACSAYAYGNPSAAARRLSAALHARPHDLLLLKLQHAVCFILGRPRDMRAGTELALSASDPALPGHAYVLGCHAFALEETGDLQAAEAAGRSAVALDPHDAWGAHAVAHVLERSDRAHSGLAWLDDVEPALQGCNNFRGHIAWHRSLFLFQLERYEAALALYDREIAVHLGRDYRDVANASSLLLRLEQEGVDVGGRWQRLAELAREHIGDHALAFADAHYMLSLVRAGDAAHARAFLAALRERALLSSHAAMVNRRAGLPIAEGLLALSEGRADQALRALARAQANVGLLGGSHAQREVFWHLLLEAARCSGQQTFERTLLERKLSLRPDNRFARTHLTSLANTRTRAA
jgi:tetratricopeptide (TPR) repeat protein